MISLASDEAAAPATCLVPTVHPSSVIRAQGADREEAYAGFVKDLQVASALLTSGH